MYACMRVCMYVRMHVYIHIHIYIYTYIFLFSMLGFYAENGNYDAWYRHRICVVGPQTSLG